MTDNGSYSAVAGVQIRLALKGSEAVFEVESDLVASKDDPGELKARAVFGRDHVLQLQQRCATGYPQPLGLLGLGGGDLKRLRDAGHAQAVFGLQDHAELFVDKVLARQGRSQPGGDVRVVDADRFIAGETKPMHCEGGLALRKPKVLAYRL